MNRNHFIRLCSLFVALICALATLPQAHAFLGFGDEEKIPGTWKGGIGTLVFSKDGNASLTNSLGMTVNFNWSLKGGRLKTWGKDTTVTGWFLKTFGADMNAEHAVSFKDKNTMVFEGIAFQRQK